MINTEMRYYLYSTFGDLNEYGTPTISDNPVGEIKMAIHLLTKNVSDNVLYEGATYIGLTKANVKDTYIIHYGEQKLKVLYVNPRGAYKQVYLCQI